MPGCGICNKLVGILQNQANYENLFKLNKDHALAFNHFTLECECHRPHLH